MQSLAAKHRLPLVADYNAQRGWFVTLKYGSGKRKKGNSTSTDDAVPELPSDFVQVQVNSVRTLHPLSVHTDLLEIVHSGGGAFRLRLSPLYGDGTCTLRSCVRGS